MRMLEVLCKVTFSLSSHSQTATEPHTLDLGKDFQRVGENVLRPGHAGASVPTACVREVHPFAHLLLFIDIDS